MNLVTQMKKSSQLSYVENNTPGNFCQHLCPKCLLTLEILTFLTRPELFLKILMLLNVSQDDLCYRNTVIAA